MEPIIEWDVVVVGGSNTDFVVRGRALPTPGTSLDGDLFLQSPGGKGANQAVAAARLGARTALVSRVGDDDRGQVLVAAVAGEGVHVVNVSVDSDAPTGAAVIHVDEHGRNQRLAALGANRRLTLNDIQSATEAIWASRVVLMQLEVPMECVKAAASIARDAGAQIVLDPGPPQRLPDDFLAVVSVIRGNAIEIGTLTGIHVHDRTSARDAAEFLIARGVEAVIVEAGESGNLLVSKSGEEWLPRLPVKTVDRTGAGDAFSAAVAVALAERRSLSEAGRLGAAAAALATTKVGAQAGLPRRYELQSFAQDVGRE